MKTFQEVKELNFEKLEKFVPVVARVHGRSHPEFLDVHKVYNQISAKLKEAGSEKPELDNEFEQLRQITNNYTLPDDICETYEAVYKMLAELDQAYQA